MAAATHELVQIGSAGAQAKQQPDLGRVGRELLVLRRAELKRSKPLDSTARVAQDAERDDPQDDQQRDESDTGP